MLLMDNLFQEKERKFKTYIAYEKISRINPYHLDGLKSLHNVMGKSIIDGEGEFRQGEEGVFSGGQCIFMDLPAKVVYELMSNLFE